MLHEIVEALKRANQPHSEMHGLLIAVLLQKYGIPSSALYIAEWRTYASALLGKAFSDNFGMQEYAGNQQPSAYAVRVAQYSIGRLERDYRSFLFGEVERQLRSQQMEVEMGIRKVTEQSNTQDMKGIAELCRKIFNQIQTR